MYLTLRRFNQDASEFRAPDLEAFGDELKWMSQMNSEEIQEGGEISFFSTSHDQFRFFSKSSRTTNILLSKTNHGNGKSLSRSAIFGGTDVFVEFSGLTKGSSFGVLRVSTVK